MRSEMLDGVFRPLGEAMCVVGAAWPRAVIWDKLTVTFAHSTVAGVKLSLIDRGVAL